MTFRTNLPCPTPGCTIPNAPTPSIAARRPRPRRDAPIPQESAGAAAAGCRKRTRWSHPNTFAGETRHYRAPEIPVLQSSRTGACAEITVPSRARWRTSHHMGARNRLCGTRREPNLFPPRVASPDGVAEGMTRDAEHSRDAWCFNRLPAAGRVPSGAWARCTDHSAAQASRRLRHDRGSHTEGSGPCERFESESC